MTGCRRFRGGFFRPGGVFAAAFAVAVAVAAVAAGPQARAGDLVLDLGSPLGLWTYTNNTTWRKINSADPDKVVVADLDGDGTGDIIADFGPGLGLWVLRNQGTWESFNANTAAHLLGADLNGNGKAELIADFGPGVGVWIKTDDQIWSRFNANSTLGLAAGDLDGNGAMDVVASLGGGNGAWAWMNNTAWVKIHDQSPAYLAVCDLDGEGRDDVVFDFQSGGLTLWMNNAVLETIEAAAGPGEAAASTGLWCADLDGDGRGELIADRGPQAGLWVHGQAAGWNRIHGLSTAALAVGDLDANGKAEVIASFGAGFGTHVFWNNETWRQLNVNAATVLAVGDIDHLTALALLAPPQNIAASLGTYPDKIKVTWDPVDGAVAYNIHRFELGSAAEFLGSTLELFFDDFTMQRGQPFKFGVTTINADGVEGNMDTHAIAKGYAGKLNAAEQKNDGEYTAN